MPKVTLTFGNIIPVTLGDRAGYEEFSNQVGSFKGGVLVIVKSNILMMVDDSSISGQYSANQLISIAQKAYHLIDSPHMAQIVPTVTVFIAPTLASQATVYTRSGIKFSNYLAPDGSFQVDLVATGCVIIQNNGFQCSNSDNGSITILSTSSTTVINDANSRAIAARIFENLNPSGLSPSSDLVYQGKKNGIYTYCYKFDDAVGGAGNGCLGVETINAKLFVIEFLSFNLSQDQIIWDTAYNTFKVLK
jgi:hypothetical protein